MKKMFCFALPRVLWPLLAPIAFILNWLPAYSQSSYVNFEGKQTRPISLSPSQTKLFAVNTPDSRLSVFDVSLPSNPRLIAEIPVGLEPVSVNARTDDEVWVINEVSDSVSVVSLSRQMVIDTLYVKDEPADILFAGGKAFISAARKNMLVVFDAQTHAHLADIALAGENPRALALNADASRLYAAFALSGNRTTIIPANLAPPQPPPSNPNLPPPPQVGLVVDATDAAWTNVVKYSMPDNDVAEIDVSTLQVTRYFSRVGTVNLGLAVHPVSGDIYVANTDARNLVHFEPGVRSHAVENRITRIVPGTSSVIPIDLNSNIDYAVLPNPAALSIALAQPTAVVFNPSGDALYAAAFGTDRIAKLSPDGGILARIELSSTTDSSADPRHKRGPRGLALNASARRLYVLNRISNTISLIATDSDSLLKEIPVGSFDPTPDTIRQGRGFLYDARLSGNGTMACASCHVDSEMDLLAWDLGDPNGQLFTNKTVLPPLNITNTSVFHPMKGPMTTQTLRGLRGLDPLHWRGDRTNFTHFNVAFPGLMGSSSLTDADMAAFRDFINTIAFQPNPNQNLDRTYPTNFAGGDANAGRNAFLFTNYAAGLFCTTCHTAPPGPGTDRLIIPATLLQESQDFKVPQLRNIYQKMRFNNTPGTNSIGGFGITHDGTDPTLQAFLSRPVFINIRSNATIKNNLASFVQCLDTGTAPAVGYTRTLTPTNISSSAVLNDWALLENQAAITNIDLVAKGTWNGQRHGFIYQPLTQTYRPDTTNQAAVTHAQLLAQIQSGDILSIMGVPPGSGVRLGIDRDLDGVLDADEPPPALHISAQPGGTVLHWPLSAAGFNLESTPSLELPWSAVLDPQEIIGDQNYLTNNASHTTQLFRLHSQ